MPLVAFVTAHDEYAVRAFDVNAIDYLLKPVDKTRLRQTLNRAQERLEHAEVAAADKARVTGIAAHRAVAQGRPFLEHVPVRQRDTILLLPVSHVAAIIADGELLHLHTLTNDRHTITYRLKDLEVRLDPTTFVRLSRGTLVRITAIAKIHVMPGGTHLAVLTNGQRLPVSRLQSRIIRDKLLRL
jgi:two-component system LytT family response regulator